MFNTADLWSVHRSAGLLKVYGWIPYVSSMHLCMWCLFDCLTTRQLNCNLYSTMSDQLELIEWINEESKRRKRKRVVLTNCLFMCVSVLQCDLPVIPIARLSSQVLVWAQFFCCIYFSQLANYCFVYDIIVPLNY